MFEFTQEARGEISDFLDKAGAQTFTGRDDLFTARDIAAAVNPLVYRAYFYPVDGAAETVLPVFTLPEGTRITGDLMGTARFQGRDTFASLEVALSEVSEMVERFRNSYDNT